MQRKAVSRSDVLAGLQDTFDVLVIGGGATGLGTALDSASRGYRTALVTSGDFAQGTSSRSTKLIHGGVRYLEQGNLGLVRDALHERARLLANAPNLVRPLEIVIPAYRRRQLAYYFSGLKAYDLLAGRGGIAPSRFLARDAVLSLVPGVRRAGLKGGIAFGDAQFNDSRLALALMKTARAHGSVVANYVEVTALTKLDGHVSGAVALDQETGAELELRARVVINATGIFTDSIRRLDDPWAVSIMNLSRGSHIVVDHGFLPGDAAVLVPRSDDGRVVFIIPWEGTTLIGTTDVPVEDPEMEPSPSDAEVDFLLRHAAMCLDRPPGRSDILSSFAALRPLIRHGGRMSSRLSRDHAVFTSDTGLVTITGGKWTTYRKMGEDTVTRAADVAGLPARACETRDLRLSGSEHPNQDWREIGAGEPEIAEYSAMWPDPLSPRLPYSMAMAAYVIDAEMPLHLDDVLSRRLRALILDSDESVRVAPKVAALMAERLGHDAAWVAAEIERYNRIAAGYMPAAVTS
jgi:glycerol-3-phosphate dehydrogenase